MKANKVSIRMLINEAKRRSWGFGKLTLICLIIVILMTLSILGWSWWNLLKTFIVFVLFVSWTLWAYDNLFIRHYGISLLSLRQAMDEDPYFIIPSATAYLLKDNMIAELEIDKHDNEAIFSWLTCVNVVPVNPKDVVTEINVAKEKEDASAESK